jgi:predicted ATPase
MRELQVTARSRLETARCTTRDRRPGLGYQVCISYLTSRRKGLFGSIGISLETSTLLLQLEGRTGFQELVRKTDFSLDACDLIELMIRYGQFIPIGRDAVIEPIHRDLNDKHLITIVGPGGIGKTTVARAVAELDNSHDDGVFLVDLSLVPNAESVPAAIATALNRTALSGNALEPALQYLKTRKTLLILDCCEHVIEAAALVADQILAAAPVTRVLATSREPLRLPAEMVEHLDALGTPPPSEELTATEAVRFPAIELFRRVAAAGAKDFKVDNFNVKRVVEICYRLDGIPLAIELAASLVGVIGIAEVERGLDERFAILTLGRRTSLPRHRTLAAALDWSYEWLPAQEQAVLRRVAAFLGSFTMDGAIAVATGGDIRDSHVRQSIIALASKSLLSVQRGADQTVYRLLETTRAYALQVPHPTGEREQAARQHASYILNVLESMDWESYDAALSSVVRPAGRVDRLRPVTDTRPLPSGPFHCVEGDLQIAATVSFRLRQTASGHVDLQGMQHELRHGERLVARLAQRDKGRLGLAGDMRVVTLLFANRAFPGRLAAAGLIIMAREDAGRVWQRQNGLN